MGPSLLILSLSAIIVAYSGVWLWYQIVENYLKAILLQTVPTHIQVDSLQQKLMEKVILLFTHKLSWHGICKNGHDCDLAPGWRHLGSPRVSHLAIGRRSHNCIGSCKKYFPLFLTHPIFSCTLNVKQMSINHWCCVDLTLYLFDLKPDFDRYAAWT